MNIWTARSIELANQEDYLDRLYEIYPKLNNPKRQITSGREELEAAYNSQQNEEFLSLLVEITSRDKLVFPMKDSYLSFIKHDPSAINRNPATVSRICDFLYGMPFEDIVNEATKPKETNRQMGPCFSTWVNSGALCDNMTDSFVEFLNATWNIVFTGNDAQKERFAQQYLGYNREKGLDLLAKFNGTFVLAEAKFLSDVGGSQNSDFEDAISTMEAPLEKTKYSVRKIAIIDGVIFLDNLATQKMQRRMRTEFSDDDVILSALLLKEYLESI